MKIIVFGATGKTGSYFVDLALQQGHEVLAFVRNPEKINIQNDNFKIFKGSPFNKEELSQAIKGQDIVVSCLGGDANKKSTVLSDMIKNIVDAMKGSNVERIIHISTAGILDEIPGVITNLMISLFLKNAIKDHRLAASYIMNSQLQYTIARPLSLTDGETKGTYRLSVEGVPKGGRNISRKDLAHFLLSNLDRKDYINKTVGISY